MRVEAYWCVDFCNNTVQFCSIDWRSYAVSRTSVKRGGGGYPLGNLGGDMPLRSVLEPFGYTRVISTDFCHPIIE